MMTTSSPLAPVKLTSFLQKRMEKASIAEAKVWKKQFLPSEREQETHQDFVWDPLQEEEVSPLPRLFHKYTEKVLVNTNDTCPVFCRFCTRKRYTEKKSALISEQEAHDIVGYIKEHPLVNEVILSGGEVFSLSEKKLFEISNIFLASGQLKKIRFHTRLPTVSPYEFAKKLPFLGQLQKICLAKKISLTLVLHINHPLEMNHVFVEVLQKLSAQSLFLKSQSVLLKNINDNVNILHNLFTKIREVGIEPYYLHHLDKVASAAHFFVEYSQGVALMKNLKKIENRNYRLPRYVIDSKQGKQDVNTWLQNNDLGKR